MIIQHPPLRYLGGKWRLAKWIIQKFPPHITYIEPFGGGAGVLLQKAPSEIEVYNDLNSNVVNFFQVLRSNTEALIKAIYLTPFSREVWVSAHQVTPDPLERALRFYIRSWQSHEPACSRSNLGWRSQRGNKRGKPVVGDWNQTDHLWNVVERLKLVQIENDDALTVIQRYDSPTSLFYVDPPYLIATRSSSNPNLYEHEMTDADHERLAATLNNVQGMVILSGYQHSLYTDLYKGWSMCSKAARTNMGTASLEMLWLSPRTVDLAHLPLFAEVVR